MGEVQSDPFHVAYNRVQLARVFTVLGEPDSAVTALETVPGLAPEWFSRAYLRIDPTWTTLRANPRFQRLIAQPDSATRPGA
jgi:hypothetical protein